MAVLGRLFRPLRAGAHRGPLSGSDFAAPTSITVISADFSDGGAMPQSSAGNGVGADISPALCWTGLPSETQQIVLIMDDVDVPLPRPLYHTAAVIDSTVDSVSAGALNPATAGIRFVRADLGNRGYAGRAQYLVMGRTTTDFTSSRSTTASRTALPRSKRCWPTCADTCWPAAC